MAGFEPTYCNIRMAPTGMATMLVAAVALLMRLVTIGLVGGLVLAVRSVLLMRLRIGGHLRLGLVALLLVPVFRLVVLE